MNCNCLYAHFAAGTQDTQCDFATIGYDYFFKHVGAVRLVALTLIDNEQRLPELYGFTILNAYRLDHTRNVGLYLVHHFHGFDDAQNIAFADTVADLYIWGGSWRCCGVYRSDHRGSNLKAVFLRLTERGSFNWRCYRSGHWGNDGWRCCDGYRSDGCAWCIPADAYRLLALGNFDLDNAGFVQ